MPYWLLVLLAGWGGILTLVLMVRRLIPFHDPGHRLFSVVSLDAQMAVIEVLARVAGLRELFTFDAGPTQTVMRDNATVIAFHPTPVSEQGLNPCAFSMPVRNPTMSAHAAVAILRSRGFTAEIREDAIPDANGRFVMVTSNAFEGCQMAFRRHVLRMGAPPRRRRLTPHRWPQV